MSNDADEVIDVEEVTAEDFENPSAEDLLPLNPHHRRHVKSTNPQLVAKERRRKAVSLRLAGAPYEEIAQKCGYASAASAGQAVRSEMKQLAHEEARDLRTLQYERLNMMLLTLQPGVMQGDPRYIQTALSVMDRMNALMGVDQQTEEGDTTNNFLIVVDGDTDTYISKLKEMAGEAIPEVGTANDNDTLQLHDDAIPTTLSGEQSEGFEVEDAGEGSDDGPLDTGESSQDQEE